MRLGIYDPEKTNIIVGVRKIDGLYNGEFITAVYNNPKRMTAISGGRGEYALSKNPDRTGVITIVTHLEPLSNQYLQSLADSGSLFPVFIQNKNETLTNLATAPEGWIEEPADFKLDEQEPGNIWIIGVGNLSIIRSKN